MPKIVAQIPEDIYRNISEEIKLGIFADASEAVVSALKKAYARKSRSFLNWLMPPYPLFVMKKGDLYEDRILTTR